MLPMPPHNTSPYAQTSWHPQGMPLHSTNSRPLEPVGSMASLPGRTRIESAPQAPLSVPTRSRLRIIAAVLVIVLAIALYFIWRSPTTTPSSQTITQQNVSPTSFATKATGTPGQAPPPLGGSGGDIQVYVVGAVKHPGVYMLPVGARVYQLLQAAGGPVPNANLVALNMAAKLNDGQEVYVAVIGETPPVVGSVSGPGTGTTGTGQLVNINTASVEQMRLALHISSTTAQKIIDYRLQHGPYTSVDQLLQVVSRSTYDKIKDLVTV